MRNGDRFTGVRLEAQQAAYLRAFVSIALELRYIKDYIDDEAMEVLGAAVQEIGRQLVKMQYPEGLLREDMFPLLFLPKAYEVMDQEEVLRDTFTELH
ncbi:MAG: hypothetical protein NZR01_02295 [Bryobacteraceae bacterium]|nr:hypothetical protein [Bryobacteraceae bacterium]